MKKIEQHMRQLGQQLYLNHINIEIMLGLLINNHIHTQQCGNMNQMNLQDILTISKCKLIIVNQLMNKDSESHYTNSLLIKILPHLIQQLLLQMPLPQLKHIGTEIMLGLLNNPIVHIKKNLKKKLINLQDILITLKCK